MNEEIMEELGEIYDAAFVEAKRVFIKAAPADTEASSEDIRSLASSLFIEYNRRIAPQYKGTRDQHEKGNNDSNPASTAQKNLIKTLVMAGGAPAEKIMADFREAYGLVALEDFKELNVLKMGQASDIITRLKEDKRRK